MAQQLVHVDAGVYISKRDNILHPYHGMNLMPDKHHMNIKKWRKDFPGSELTAKLNETSWNDVNTKERADIS